MNKILAEAAAVLNGLSAVITIVAFAITGYFFLPYYFGFNAHLSTAPQYNAQVAGLIAGAAVGFIVAIMVNGVLALFIQMYRELKAIRQQLIDTKPLQAPTSPVRVEPRMPALAA